MLTSRKRCVRRPPDVCLPLPKVVLVCAQADVFVWRGGLQLVHLFPQSLGASQRHPRMRPMILLIVRSSRQLSGGRPSSTRTADKATPVEARAPCRYHGPCNGFSKTENSPAHSNTFTPRTYSSTDRSSTDRSSTDRSFSSSFAAVRGCAGINKGNMRYIDRAEHVRVPPGSMSNYCTSLTGYIRTLWSSC